MGRAVRRLRGRPGLLLRGGGLGPALVQSPDSAGLGSPGSTEAESGTGHHGKGGAALPAPGDSGAGIGVEGSREGWQQRCEPPGRAEGRAASSSGVWAAQVCNFLTPLSPSCIPYSFLSQMGPRGRMETKGTGQVVEGCRLTGSKRSFAVCQIISRSWIYWTLKLQDENQ